MKGNVVDLAVAVVIGAAFAGVVNSLVGDVLMPLISMLVGEPDFSNFLVFGAVRFGAFLTVVINFLLVAAAIYFVVVVPMNHMIERRNRRLGITPAAEEADPQVVLLTEIRDSLRARQ